MSLGFVIMKNRMTKESGPLSNIADRRVRLNPKGQAAVETYKGQSVVPLVASFFPSSKPSPTWLHSKLTLPDLLWAIRLLRSTTACPSLPNMISPADIGPPLR